MNNKHKYLPLAQIEAGAILADDLLDKIGHVLLPKGTTLSAATLKSIAHHDIHHLSVLSDVDQEPPREYDLSRVVKIFRHMPNEGPTVALKTYIERYRKGGTS